MYYIRYSKQNEMWYVLNTMHSNVFGSFRLQDVAEKICDMLNTH